MKWLKVGCHAFNPLHIIRISDYGDHVEVGTTDLTADGGAHSIDWTFKGDEADDVRVWLRWQG